MTVRHFQQRVRMCLCPGIMKITQGGGTEVYEKVDIDDFKRSAALKKDRKKKVVIPPYNYE